MPAKVFLQFRVGKGIAGLVLILPNLKLALALLMHYPESKMHLA
jgi:hypothetical protein